MTTPYAGRIVIVGGGTAGWLTAGIIAAYYRTQDAGGLSVTLVESPNVPIIGVGEGTWPTMRRTLQQMGIAEADFLVACDASFKQGSKFIDWTTSDRQSGDVYYHPFVAPAGFGTTDVASIWAAGPQALPFGDAVSFQPAICEAGLAPKAITTPEYAGVANYGYHLDAGKFAGFLRDHCVGSLGVHHIRADVTAVEAGPDGDIAQLQLDGHAAVTGDLFVDCTGFAAVLIGKHFGVPFKSVQDQLFIDSALAIQLPYNSPSDAIASATLSTAHPAGWIWDIGLPTRRGVGCLYASAFVSSAGALAELSAYVGSQGPPLNDGDVRQLSIVAGHRETFWVGNCVAVGLAAGFVEPLEASSIIMTELAAQMIAGQFPARREAMAIVAKSFNGLFLKRWRAVVDFLKLHYLLSRRTEPFWVTNRQSETVSDTLAERLELWRDRSAAIGDFAAADDIFTAASYQYILHGMGHAVDPPPWAAHRLDGSAAAALFRDVTAMRLAMPQRLPTNRDLLARIKAYGLQKV